ncbi:Uncharacterised protein [Bordetella pertussis]|nr:Uncharacterised protein [Bordetella pertussis]CFP59423.1 Uncharacterised protein [Bordetella pertussis]
MRSVMRVSRREKGPEPGARPGLGNRNRHHRPGEPVLSIAKSTGHTSLCECTWRRDKYLYLVFNHIECPFVWSK